MSENVSRLDVLAELGRMGLATVVFLLKLAGLIVGVVLVPMALIIWLGPASATAAVFITTTAADLWLMIPDIVITAGQWLVRIIGLLLWVVILANLWTFAKTRAQERESS